MCHSISRPDMYAASSRMHRLPQNNSYLEGTVETLKKDIVSSEQRLEVVSMHAKKKLEE